MNKKQRALYFFFWKSNLFINVVVSLLFSTISFSATNFSIAFLTIGFWAPIAYRELARKKEYYFYFNAGISKSRLMLVCYLLDTVLVAILFIVDILWHKF